MRVHYRSAICKSLKAVATQLSIPISHPNVFAKEANAFSGSFLELLGGVGPAFAEKIGVFPMTAEVC